MKNILCVGLVLLLLFSACCAEVTRSGMELLGELEDRLESMEGSNFYVYSQLNNAQADNRIVYDENNLYFCWNNSLYCAGYDGEDVWELTDTLKPGTSIAYAGGRIYFTTNVGGTDYIASIKTDGSEMPAKLSSYASLDKTFRGDFNYNSMNITRLVAPRDYSGKIYFTYSLYEVNVFQYNDDDRGEQVGIGVLNCADGKFANLARWSRNYRSESWKNNYSLMTGAWIQEDYAYYDSPVKDGIRVRDRASDAVNVISVMNPVSLIAWNDRVYFIERDTNKLYRMNSVGAQKRKLLDNVQYFVITDSGLLLYITDGGLFAADPDGKGATLVSADIQGRFYLMGDWVYYFTAEGLLRLNLHTGMIQTAFDPAWL